jgi:integrase
VKKYAARARSERTLAEYARDVRLFTSWCGEQGFTPLPAPPEVVCAFITALADGLVRVRWRAGKHGGQVHETCAPKKVSTIERAFAAISAVHQMRGHSWPHRHPLFLETLEGIRRTLGVARTKKTPIEVERLAVCLAAHKPRTELATVRDRAICAVGFFAALRRSEAARLDFGDVKFTTEGIIIEIRRSKTDQRGAGKQRAILYQRDVDVCAVRLLKAWLDASGIVEGAIFRGVNKAGRLGARRLTGRAVADIVKQIAKAGGLDPKACGGHSLRSGFATTAGRKGKSLHTIMQQGGWTNPKTALDYIRPTQLFRDNATEGLT